MPTRVILGRKLSGKTTLAKKFLAVSGPTLIIDPNGEHRVRRKTDSHRILFDWLKRPLSQHIAYVQPFCDRDEFDTICEIVLRLRVPRLHVEEVADFVSPTVRSVFFATLCRRDRHFGVELLATSQRPAEVPRELTANNDLYCFRFSEPRDRDYCARMIPNYETMADCLDEHECIVYHGETGAAHILPADSRPGDSVRRAAAPPN